MAVRREFSAVYELLENLIAAQGAENVLNELANVMSSNDLADALEDVAENWGIEVNGDGTLY